MWTWDPEEGRYYNEETGEYLDREDIEVLILLSMLMAGYAVGDLAVMLADGVLTSLSWKYSMQQQIKREYIRQYLLGIGGRSRMTFTDWGILGEMIEGQYGFLEGFVEALPELSEAQIAARSRMYINSARQAYETARGRVATDLGYDEEIWILGAFVDHCPDCEEFAAMGWQPIGFFPMPGDGSTVCLSHCQCTKAYRNSVTGEEWDG